MISILKKNKFEFIVYSIAIIAILFILFNHYSAFFLCPEMHREGSDCYVSWWSIVEKGQIILSIVLGSTISYIILKQKNKVT